MAADSNKTVYCQVDAHLDTNPKIRKGGREAREIFQFLLRRIAISASAGTVPISFIDPEYLADQLQMPVTDARHGTSRAVTVRLIEIDEAAGVVHIVGWSPEWGRAPKSGKERQAAYRAKQPKPLERVTPRDEVSSPPSPVTPRDESDVGEERRGEERISLSAANEIRAGRFDQFDPETPGAKNALAEWAWGETNRRRLALAKEFGLAAPIAFARITPARVPSSFRELLARVAEEGPEAPAICQHVLEAATVHARKERSVEWVAEKLFTEGGWRWARGQVPTWRSAATPAAAAPVDTRKFGYVNGQRVEL